GHLGGALEQARVDVEDVARVRLASRRTTEEERELTVRDRLLREIVVDAECVAPAVPEVLGHRDAGVRRDELERRGLAGAGDDDGRVLHRAMRGQLVDDARDGGLLLPDRDVEAVNALALLV